MADALLLAVVVGALWVVRGFGARRAHRGTALALRREPTFEPSGAPVIGMTANRPARSAPAVPPGQAAPSRTAPFASAWSARPPAPEPTPSPAAYDPGPVLAKRLRYDAVIVYRDRDGEHTQRRVTVLALHGDRDRRTGFVYARVVQAFCHLRREPRHFVVSRVAALADPETGEVFEGVRDIARWLRFKAGVLSRAERHDARLAAQAALYSAPSSASLAAGPTRPVA